MSETIDIIAGQLRDAAVDPSGWTTALNSINVFVRGAGAVVLSVEERLRHAPCSIDLDEMVDDYFRNGWYAADRREGCVPLLRQKYIALDYEFMAIDENDPFHADFLSRHKRKWFAGLGANLDGDLWCLALQRSITQGAFLQSDMPRLAAVQTKLEEAASLSRMVARGWLNGAISALDGVGAAAIVLSRYGRTLEMNEAARFIVCGPRGVRKPKLFEDTLLTHLVNLRWSGRHATEIFMEFAQQSYAVEVTPLRDNAGLIFSKASMLVQLRPQSLDPQNVLRTKYRLTSSEARVAMALASGMSVEAIAEAFHVTRNTIRAHLKAAYAKTQVGGQARLVTLISQIRVP